MKIRIENQIFDVDEDTLSEWIKMGRISADASIFFDGRWLPIGELEGFHQLRSAENQPDTDSLQGEASERDSLAEKGFLASQRSYATVTLSLIAVNTIIYLLLDEVMRGSRNALTLIQFGAYSHRLVVYDGEYWRLITHTFLHGGSLHLLLNMGVLFVVGNLLERLYGGSRFLVLYLFSAIGGSLATLYFVRDAPSVGASGAIFGLMGALVALGLRYRDRLPRRRNRIFGLGLLPFIACDIFLGFTFPHINNAAHLGGLAVGFAGGLILTPAIYANSEHEPKSVQALASVLTGMVITCSAVAVWHFFADSEQTIERRMNTAFPPLSVESLPDYIQRYEKALRRKGYNPEEYAFLEELYWWARDNSPEDTSWTAKLIRFYEQALRADPHNAAWNNNLAWLYVEQQMMPQKAVEYAQKAVMHDPRKTVFLDTLAWAYLRNTQHDRALKTFEQVFLTASETEADLHAQGSSWKGLTDLVQAEIKSEKSQEFNRAFLNFYNRLSQRLGSDTEARAKLDAVFNLFQTHHKE
jgi:membrane associated rhomboid family serine protease/Tfp pilus assembly protein PilF